MAHELAHVKHRDILISTISATMAGAISMLANFAMFFGGRDEEGRSTNPIAGIAVAILAPLAASVIQMAISRAREFEADRGGAEISGDPAALASALDKIHRYAQGIPLHAAEAHPETAQMMTANPLSGGGLRGLFSTHPATEERIARLMEMARRTTSVTKRGRLPLVSCVNLFQTCITCGFPAAALGGHRRCQPGALTWLTRSCRCLAAICCRWRWLSRGWWLWAASRTSRAGGSTRCCVRCR